MFEQPQSQVSPEMSSTCCSLLGQPGLMKGSGDQFEGLGFSVRVSNKIFNDIKRGLGFGTVSYQD